MKRTIPKAQQCYNHKEELRKFKERMTTRCIYQLGMSKDEAVKKSESIKELIEHMKTGIAIISYIGVDGTHHLRKGTLLYYNKTIKKLYFIEIYDTILIYCPDTETWFRVHLVNRIKWIKDTHLFY